MIALITPLGTVVLKRDEAVAFALSVFSFLVGMKYVFGHAPTWQAFIYSLGAPALVYLVASLTQERLEDGRTE